MRKNQEPNDLSRKEILELAESTLAHYAPGAAEVYFKFTCEHCGERCTFADPNVLYHKGECHVCHKETEVIEAGFMMLVRTDGLPLDEDDPQGDKKAEIGEKGND